MRRPFTRGQRYKCPAGTPSDQWQRLSQVWHLDSEGDGSVPVPPKPYFEYWHALRADVRYRSQSWKLYDSGHISKIVSMVRSRPALHLSVLRDEIHKLYHSSGKTQASITHDEAAGILSFAILLWLHLDLNLQPQSLPSGTLKEIVARTIPQPPLPQQILPNLPLGFCAKYLVRMGGFEIRYTDNIKDHLDLKSNQIFVFRHAGMLRALENDPKFDPFPPGFVSETLETLKLLFRPRQKNLDRYRKRLSEKTLEWDLELAVSTHAQFDLTRYKFWWERLRKIQLEYESKSPSTLKQWWFDRRDRVQWATFWVAFLVLMLTIIFGLIQSITGILQVYAAYHPAAPPSSS